MPERSRPLAAILGLVLVLSACAGRDGPVGQQASLDPAGAPGAADPYEATNRALLESNLWTYDAAIAPAVEAYRWAVPAFLRDGVSNVFDNLAQPRVFVNGLLQGEWERAAESLTRFAFNTTIGFGGLFDRASEMGLPAHDEDFGQTLAVHGVEPGPYLVLPLFGPSNPRDGVGRVVDMALDPANYLLFPIALGANLVGSTLDRFGRDPAQLETARAQSLDFYVTLRDAYLQNRAYEVANGAVVPNALTDPLEAEDALSRELQALDLEPSAGAAPLWPLGSSGPHP